MNNILIFIAIFTTIPVFYLGYKAKQLKDDLKKYATAFNK